MWYDGNEIDFKLFQCVVQRRSCVQETSVPQKPITGHYTGKFPVEPITSVNRVIAEAKGRKSRTTRVAGTLHPASRNQGFFHRYSGCGGVLHRPARIYGESSGHEHCRSRKTP